MTKNILVETGIEKFPDEIKHWLKDKLSKRETVLFSACNSGFKPEGVVVTDFNLVVYTYGGLLTFPAIKLPMQWESGIYIVPLEDLHTAWQDETWGVALHLRDVQHAKSLFGSGYQQAYGFQTPFVDEVMAKRFATILMKAVTEAKVRIRNPQAFSTGIDIGDQLTKLAALRDKGDLTQVEFEAAKKKLLGT